MILVDKKSRPNPRPVESDLSASDIIVRKYVNHYHLDSFEHVPTRNVSINSDWGPTLALEHLISDPDYFSQLVINVSH